MGYAVKVSLKLISRYLATISAPIVWVEMFQILTAERFNDLIYKEKEKGTMVKALLYTKY